MVVWDNAVAERAWNWIGNPCQLQLKRSHIFVVHGGSFAMASIRLYLHFCSIWSPLLFGDLKMLSDRQPIIKKWELFGSVRGQSYSSFCNIYGHKASTSAETLLAMVPGKSTSFLFHPRNMQPTSKLG